jgi:hypothetical protein
VFSPSHPDMSARLTNVETSTVDRSGRALRGRRRELQNRRRKGSDQAVKKY